MRNLIRFAEQGDADSQFELGLIYAQGKEVKQDYEKAVFWFQKAAENGHLGAMSNLGIHYCIGQGCAIDYAQGLMWWEKAANLGDANAMYNLGVAYAEGEIVKRNLSKATELFLQAEELGCERASSALANMDDDDYDDEEEDDDYYGDYDEDCDDEFDANEFTYSIDIAAKIYAKLKTQEDANNEFYKQLEGFFAEKGIEYKYIDGSGVAGFGGSTYMSDEQTITVLVQFGNEPSVFGIVLPTYGTYTKQIFNTGLNNKCLFGLPIFRMQWFEEMDRAFIYFINRKSYLEYDTPRGRIEKDLFGF